MEKMILNGLHQLRPYIRFFIAYLVLFTTFTVTDVFLLNTYFPIIIGTILCIFFIYWVNGLYKKNKVAMIFLVVIPFNMLDIHSINSKIIPAIAHVKTIDRAIGIHSSYLAAYFQTFESMINDEIIDVLEFFMLSIIFSFLSVYGGLYEEKSDEV
jgi:hypothetical protein